MNQSTFQKCDICDTIIHIKVQAGFVDKVPFSYSCPKCKSPIKGMFELDQNLGTIKLVESINSIQLYDLHPSNYLIQLSSELYTNKILEKSRDDLLPRLSPVLEYAFNIDLEYISEYSRLIYLQFPNREMIFKRQISLLLGDESLQSKLLKDLKHCNIVHKNIKLKNFIRFSNEELLELIKRFSFDPILTDVKYANNKSKIKKHFLNIKNSNSKEVLKLKELFKHDYDKIISNTTKIMSDFQTNILYFLPVVVNELEGSINIKNIADTKGIYTSDFESFKNMYSDNYEILTKYISCLIFLENIDLRNDISDFSIDAKKHFPVLNNVSYKDFESNFRKAGNRVKILNFTSNFLSDIIDFDLVLNAGIRNSISHHDYEYNQNDQLIIFKNKKNDETMFYIEFVKILYDGFLLSDLMSYLFSLIQDS